MNRKIAGMRKKRSRGKEDIIRVGDTIKITQPYLFIRCGYSLTLEKCRELILQDEKYMKIKQEIAILINKQIKTPTSNLLDYNNTTCLPNNLDYEIDNLLAKIYITANNFGGPQRTLHTKYDEKLKGLKAEVLDIKFHKTGTYTPGYSCANYYDGGADYCPAYLSDEQTHKILCINLLSDVLFPPITKQNTWTPADAYYWGDAIWIEDTNVVKIKGEEHA